MNGTGSYYVPSTISTFRRLTTDQILGRTIVPGTTIELRIRISEQNVRVGHLYSFLRILDRAYGRLLFGDLRRYAFQPDMQLSATTFEKGSWEIVLTQLVSQLPNATPLLIIFVLLKLLPKAAESTASAYKTLQEGKLIRDRRKAMRQKLNDDRKLSQLPPNMKRLLLKFANQLIDQEPKVGREALEFSEEHLIEARIKVAKPRSRKKK